MSAIEAPLCHGAKPSLLHRIYQLYEDRRARHRAIDQLSKLDDHNLRDLGIERVDIGRIVDREIGRLQLDEFRSRG